MSLLNTLIKIEIQEKAKLSALKLNLDLPKDEFDSTEKSKFFKQAKSSVEKNIVSDIELTERTIFSILQQNQ